MRKIQDVFFDLAWGNPQEVKVAIGEVRKDFPDFEVWIFPLLHLRAQVEEGRVSKDALEDFIKSVAH